LHDNAVKISQNQSTHMKSAQNDLQHLLAASTKFKQAQEGDICSFLTDKKPFKVYGVRVKKRGL
jgi:hypothetical protein